MNGLKGCKCLYNKELDFSKYFWVNKKALDYAGAAEVFSGMRGKNLCYFRTYWRGYSMQSLPRLTASGQAYCPDYGEICVNLYKN